ncbi:MAG TPA: hypothetical protein VK466_15855 [Terriglobales bacterium]|nr:hypothetical protein [Terriglobales bacterium]
MVELIDRDAWVEILREEGLLRGVFADSAVRGATEAFIWDMCRDYRREKAQAELSKMRAPITGLIDRETESRGPTLIKAKHRTPPRREAAGGMTAFEIELERDGISGFDDGPEDKTLREGNDNGFDDAEDFEAEGYSLDER